MSYSSDSDRTVLLSLILNNQKQMNPATSTGKVFTSEENRVIWSWKLAETNSEEPYAAQRYDENGQRWVWSATSETIRTEYPATALKLRTNWVSP